MTHPESQAELLPCPFCNGEAIMQEIEPHSHAGGLASFMPDYPGSFTIECCGKGCNTGQIADTRAEVVAMWNRRAALPPVAAVPEGYVLVPIEPTMDMIVSGFESAPAEGFCPIEVWEEYDAMSGCQQAAHRAKLCWAAMIAAVSKAPATTAPATGKAAGEEE